MQRAVTAVLDELAPERVLQRTEKLPDAVEQHRTPTGCVLQAKECAVSVSWFSGEEALGELHVLVWRGKVTRRGTAPSRNKATIVTELILSPVESSGEVVWQAADGSRHDTSALVAKCVALLEAQIGEQR